MMYKLDGYKASRSRGRARSNSDPYPQRGRPRPSTSRSRRTRNRDVSDPPPPPESPHSQQGGHPTPGPSHVRSPLGSAGSSTVPESRTTTTSGEQIPGDATSSNDQDGAGHEQQFEFPFPQFSPEYYSVERGSAYPTDMQTAHASSSATYSSAPNLPAHYRLPQHHSVYAHTGNTPGVPHTPSGDFSDVDAGHFVNQPPIRSFDNQVPLGGPYHKNSP